MNETPSRRRSIHLIRFELAPKTIAAVLLTCLALWLIGQLVSVIVVIVCASILVGTLSPFVLWLEDRRFKRVWAITLVAGVCALAGGLVSLIVFPALWDQIMQISGNLPAIQKKLADILVGNRLTVSLAAAVRNFGTTKTVSNGTVTSAVAVSLTILEVIGYAATAIVLAIYFIADYERMRGVLYAFIPREYHLRLARVLLNLQDIVGGYMRGQLITSVAITVFAFGLLSICKVPNALALSAFAGITDVIPFVGGLLATTPAVLSAFSRGTGIVMVVLTAMVVYQEFESRVLVPRVYGRALRLPPATVVIALLVGGKLGGIVGALLALPLAAALRMLIEELRLELPGDDTEDLALKKRDERAERAYAKQSAGSTPAEAGAVAATIADQIRTTDEKDVNEKTVKPITGGK